MESCKSSSTDMAQPVGSLVTVYDALAFCSVFDTLVEIWCCLLDAEHLELLTDKYCDHKWSGSGFEADLFCVLCLPRPWREFVASHDRSSLVFVHSWHFSALNEKTCFITVTFTTLGNQPSKTALCSSHLTGLELSIWPVPSLITFSES